MFDETDANRLKALEEWAREEDDLREATSSSAPNIYQCLLDKVEARIDAAKGLLRIAEDFHNIESE